MELRQLQYFVAVSKDLSFSKAARRLFVSQSAISHQIARFEHELGVSLFDRSTRTVTLTEVGARVLPIAAQMLDLAASIATTARMPRNRLRLAANMTFASKSLSAIAEVRADYPDAEIEFVIRSFDQRIDAVVSGDADMALIRGGISRAGLVVTPLWMDDLLIAMAADHPLADHESVDLSELAEYPLLMPPVSQQVLLHNVIGKKFGELGITPRFGPPIARDHTATLELINNPRAWTVLYDDSAVAGIAYLRETHGRLNIQVSAVTRPDSDDNPLLPQLIEALRDDRA